MIEEIQIIGSLNHPNVVVMKDHFETLQHMFIMMECMEGGELFDHIKEYEISGKLTLKVKIFRERSRPNRFSDP